MMKEMSKAIMEAWNVIKNNLPENVSRECDSALTLVELYLEKKTGVGA